MELQGKIIAVLPIQGGESKNGNTWSKQEYVLESADGEYTRRMVFSIFGADKIQEANLRVNDEVKVLFNIDAREYNGRWYNDIKAWRVERTGSAPAPKKAAPQPQPQPSQEGDGLPF